MLPHVALLLAAHFAAPPKPPPKDLPVPRYAIPFALPAGPKVKLALRGARLDTATEVKAEGVGVKLLAKRKAAVPNNYPAGKVGDTEVEVEVELPKDFSGDSVTFTVTTPAGTSAPLAVPLAKAATAETEPNDGFDKAQKVTLPAAVDATIGREKDTDLFQFAGKKGQKVTVEVLAGVYGSPADLLLTVYDARKQVVVIVDDVGEKPDPKAELTLPADGVYYISVLEANDLGGTGYGYRLKVE
jgi:hypothetical protein